MATKPLIFPRHVFPGVPSRSLGADRPSSPGPQVRKQWPAILDRGGLPRIGAAMLVSGMLLSLGGASRELSVLDAGTKSLAPPVRGNVLPIAPSLAGEYPYRSLIAEMATKYGLSPELVAGVVYIESNFDRKSVSDAGAVGLMQLMPSTAQPLARRLGLGPVDLMEPRMNLELGCYYLRALLNKYDGHLPTALSYYNGGRWGIVSRGVYRNRRYIRKVMDSYWRYAQPVSNGFSTATDLPRASR